MTVKIGDDYLKGLERSAGEHARPDVEEPAVERIPADANSFTHLAREVVFDYVMAVLEKTDTHVKFRSGDVYVVWACKTLQNWKALVSTGLPDGMYYEVTYNGDADEIYLDAYKKFDNIKYNRRTKVNPETVTRT